METEGVNKRVRRRVRGTESIGLEHEIDVKEEGLLRERELAGKCALYSSTD
jgi:hypothetical protein